MVIDIDNCSIIATYKREREREREKLKEIGRASCRERV